MNIILFKNQFFFFQFCSVSDSSLSFDVVNIKRIFCCWCNESYKLYFFVKNLTARFMSSISHHFPCTDHVRSKHLGNFFNCKFSRNKFFFPFTTCVKIWCDQFRSFSWSGHNGENTFIRSNNVLLSVWWK